MTEPMMRVQAILTDRDHVLLGWLYDHGLLTSFQIAHALYPSLDFAQKRLRKLVAIGLLTRFRPQKPDGGSYPYHYVLDQLGVEVVAAQRGEDLPRKDQARQRRWHLTNRANLPHLLGVNQFFIDLARYARTHPEASLDRWWPAARCQQLGAFREPDEDNIQVLAYKAKVRPDGHGIWTERDRQVPFFVEFDNNTEPLWKLIAKLDGYKALATMYQQVWPVLFSLHSAVRERHLHQEMSADGVRYPVATTARDHTTQAGRCPAEAVWWVHRYDGALLRLADLSATVIGNRDQAA